MTTIKLRRGLSTAFSTNNPVLAAGEPAFATDTGILKIGDGTTAYNSLPSIGASPDLTNYVTTNTAQTISATKTFSANQNIGSIQVDCSSPTIRPTGTMSFRRDASSSSSDTVGIRFNAADNTNGGVACGVHSSSSYKGGLLLYTNDAKPYRYYPSIMFSPYGTPDSLNADITCYNNTALNVRATTVNIGAQTSQSSGTYTGLRIAADGSLLEYNNNKVLDSSCVDGSTITYNSSTGKISANVTVADFTGADGTDAGTHGLVPAPTATDNVKYLRGDGSWATPTDTTYSAFTGTDGSSAGSAGLVPAPATTDAGKFLCADGSWETPSSSAPSNMVTTDTAQTISGAKTFTGAGNAFNRTQGQQGTRFTNSTRSGCWIEPDYAGSSYNQIGLAVYSGLYDSTSKPTISFAGKGDYERTFISTNPNGNQSVMMITAPYINIGSTVDFTNNTSYSGLHIDGYGTTGMRYNGKYVPTSPDINNIVKVTQAAYDALATKDANTFYVIIPASS